MSIRDVIATINQIEADGVIDRYAIGGAVGATFYLEPVAPLDVGVFVAFRSEPEGLLASPKPVFDYLLARGCSLKGEYVIIGGWPVQFLPPTGPLVEDALAAAVEADVDGERAGLHRRAPRRHRPLDRPREGQGAPAAVHRGGRAQRRDLPRNRAALRSR